MRTLYFFLYLSFLFSGLVACQQEEPTSFQPILTLEDASGITRHEAHLQGTVTITGNNTSITSLQFCYGTSKEMTQHQSCAPDNYTPHVSLQNLTANTTYYYCLEVGNGYQNVRSEVRQFQTLPNQKPSLGTLECVIQGPQSFTLQCPLLDNGGDPLTEAGFYYTAQGGTEQKMVLAPLPSTTLQGRIGKLQLNTEYTLQAYAKNSMGETRSQPLTRQTSHAVILKEAGQLLQALGDEERYQLTELQIIGPINGTDLRAIRDVLGCGIEGKKTPGKLQVLNLTDATICAGGSSYNGLHYSQDRVVGKRLFADCEYLTELSLPDNTQILEKEAIQGCPLLRKLYLPTSVEEVEPSVNCPQLSEIAVIHNHPKFKVYDGVLYSRNGQVLIWFPEGKKEVQFLPSVTHIGANALRNCRIQIVKLPDSITQIEDGAFAGASLENITLPQNIQMITKGLFQGCKQLTQVTLGARTNYLEDFCFEECPLQHLYVPVTDFPPHCCENTFQPSHYTSCTLHVPAASLSFYRSSKIWGKFQQIQGESKGQ